MKQKKETKITDMENSNGRFCNNKQGVFESLTQNEMQRLCLSDISFTELTGFLFLRKKNANSKQKVSKKLLFSSMKELLKLSQN